MIDDLRIRAEDARAEYERACDLRYPSISRGEPVEDLTDLLDEAEAAEDAYLAALGEPVPAYQMASSHPNYIRGEKS